MKTKITALAIVLVVMSVVGIFVYFAISPPRGFTHENTQSETTSSRSTDMSETYREMPKPKTIKEIEEERPGDYISVGNVSFENIILSRKLAVTGNIYNSSKTLHYENVVVGIEFYNEAQYKLHETQITVNGSSFDNDIRIPLSVAKLDIKNVRCKILSFQAFSGVN